MILKSVISKVLLPSKRHREGMRPLLEQCHRMFDVVFNTRSLGVGILTRKGVLMRANASFFNMLGVDSGAVLNQHLKSFLPLDNWTDAVDGSAELSNEICQTGQDLFVEKSGLWLNVVVAPHTKKKNGDTDFFVVHLYNVTNRFLNGPMSSGDEIPYRAIFNISPDLIVVSNLASGDILEVNNGWSQNPVVGQYLKTGQKLTESPIFVSPHDIVGLVENVQNLGEDLGREMVLDCPTGQKTVAQVTARAIVFGGKKLMVAVFRDITENKLAEELLGVISKLKPSGRGNSPVNELLVYLGSVFGADVLVAGTINKKTNKAKTFSVVEGGKTCDNFEYDLDGTPGQSLVDGKIGSYNSNVQTLFPSDGWLAQMNAHSYIGVPLVDLNDRVIGLLSAAGKQPFANPRLVVKMLQIAARPVAAEIQRAKTELKLIVQEGLYRQLADNISDVVWITDLDFKVKYISPSVHKHLGYTPEDILAMDIGRFIDSGDLERARNQLNGMLDEFMAGNEIDLNNIEVVKAFTKDGRHLFFEMTTTLLVENQVVTAIQGTAHDITERKIAEERLRESEQRFRQLFEENVSIMLLVDPESGNILDANQMATQFYGYQRHELCGMNVSQINAMSSLVVFEMLKRMASGSQKYFIVPHKTSQGELKTVEIRPSVVYLNGAALVFAIVYDITKVVEVQEAKEIAESKYRQLFENLSAGFALHELVVDDQNVPVDYRYLDMNPHFEKMMGLSRDLVLGRTVRELFPDFEVKWLDRFANVALKGDTFFVEDYSNELGRYYSVIAYSPQRMQFAVVAHDITDLKTKERDLVESEEQLNMIFDHTHAGLILLNDKLEIVKMNQAGYDLAGRNNLVDCNGLVLGNVLRCINSVASPLGCGHGPACGDCVVRTMAYDTLANRESRAAVEVQFDQQDGPQTVHRYFDTSMALISILGKKHVLLTIDDLTIRKFLEFDLMNAKNRAEESDRLKSAFFNNLSHEIRTPLNGIVGFSNLLKKEDISASDISLYTYYINENSTRLLQIMNNVIELSSLSSGVLGFQARRIDLEDCMVRVLSLQKANLEKRKTRVMYRFRGSTTVGLDVKIIESVVFQLVDNAIKFSAEGTVDVRWYVSDKKISCLVADTGIGIAPDQLEKIFTPFKQVEDGMTRNYGGVGLGLAIVKAHLQRGGGTVAVRSELGKGSVFRFCLPLMVNL